MKALISCAVTMQLIFAFVFAYAKSRLSHPASQLRSDIMSKGQGDLLRDKKLVPEGKWPFKNAR